MTETVTVRLVASDGYGRELPHLDTVVEPGATVEVPAALAGRPPSGKDPGEGLLAQADTWAPGDGRWNSPAAGTVDEVLAWVGDNAKRARAALATERARDKPRVTLVERLTEIVGDADTEDGSDQ